MPAMPGVHPRDFVFGKDYSLMPASDCAMWGVGIRMFVRSFMVVVLATS